MKTLAVLACLAISPTAIAHFELGLYKGTDTLGRPCAINFKSKTYINNKPHPLNELVAVEAESAEFLIPLTLKHPPHFNLETGKIGFNHDALASVEASSEGAVGVSVVMKHEDGKAEGPQSFLFSVDNWKKPELSKVVNCNDLAHQGN